MGRLWIGMLVLVIAIAAAGCPAKPTEKKKVVPTTPPAGAVRDVTPPTGAVVEPTIPAAVADVATEAAAATIDAAAIVQKTCPVMEGPINPKIYVDHEGRRIYFCCNDCVEAFKKDPAKYLPKVDEQLKEAAKPGVPESK